MSFLHKWQVCKGGVSIVGVCIPLYDWMPHTSGCPHMSVCPHTFPVYVYVPLYYMFPKSHGDLGASVHSICLRVFGGHQCHCTTAATSIWDTSSAPYQLCYGSPAGRFLFQSWVSHHLYFYMFLVSVLVSAFCFQVPCWMPYSPIEAQLLGFAPLQPFGAYP